MNAKYLAECRYAANGIYSLVRLKMQLIKRKLTPVLDGQCKAPSRHIFKPDYVESQLRSPKYPWTTVYTQFNGLCLAESLSDG